MMGSGRAKLLCAARIAALLLIASPGPGCGPWAGLRRGGEAPGGRPGRGRAFIGPRREGAAAQGSYGGRVGRELLGLRCGFARPSSPA